MAPEASRPVPMTAAIAQVSSLARASRDRVWQRELLDLAAACSAYTKNPRPREQERIVAKARGLVAVAGQLGEDATAATVANVIAALTAPPAPPAPSAAPTPAVVPLSGRVLANQAVTDPLAGGTSTDA